MLVQDILSNDTITAHIRPVIYQECSDFIAESGGLPLYKTLPDTYNDFQRVKVRLQKRRNEVSNVFEQAFGEKFNNFRQRSVFASSSLHESSDAAFYVFPTNGYKYMYSKEVENSSDEYMTVIDTLFQSMSNVSEATQLVTDLVKYTYTSTNLREGISAGAEVILYNIPAYYAVRVTACPKYTDLINR